MVCQRECHARRAQRWGGYRGGRIKATAKRPGGPFEHGQPDRGGDDGSAMRRPLKAATSFFPSVSHSTVAACCNKMATLDGRVWGRVDPFFSLTLSLSLQPNHVDGFEARRRLKGICW